MDKKIEIAGKRMNLSEFMVYAGTVLLAIMSFTSFVGIGDHGDYFVDNYSFIGNGGIIAIVLAVVASLCVLLKFEIIAIPVSVVLDVYTIYKLFFGIIERDEFAKIRMGGWITLIICIVITIGCYLCYKNSMYKKNIK